MNANNPFLLNPDLVTFELPSLSNNPTPPPKKPGPARAWPAYKTDWSHLLDIEPHADSPLHE
jgi:hypothetical protein